MFISFLAQGQSLETTTNLEHGLLISSRIDSDDDFSFNIKGFGLEGGYYFLKQLGKKGMISLDVRLAYARSERYYFNILDQRAFFQAGDMVITQRSGTVNYQNISLAIPIKYRYLIKEDAPIFLLLGFSPYFSLSNQSKWRFDEFERNVVSDMIITENRDQEETLKQSLYSHDLILAGLGFKSGNLMWDIYFSGGSTNFDNDFITFMDKLSIVLNVYYRL